MNHAIRNRAMPRLAAACLIALGAATVHAHGPQAHSGQGHAHKPAVAKKEQKDWGIAGDARAAKRTIHIRMLDSMRFVPDRLEIRQGETVRFVIANEGKMMHEFVIGTKAENDAHAQQMIKFPNMEHDEPYMAHVGPGKKGEIVWTFNRAGNFDFACLIAGHYQAGMVGTIQVTASPAGTSTKDSHGSHRN